jgi:dipeptidyl aminopeptidase/acylaminoacyl peptidase
MRSACWIWVACLLPLLGACHESGPHSGQHDASAPRTGSITADGGRSLGPSQPAAQSSSYAGHGLDSVAPELLQKFRPRPASPGSTQHLQQLMDVRAPGLGRLSPDGKSLYFSWTITGVAQVWKVDGPQRFPEQVTGGEDPTTLSAITPDGAWLVLQRDRKGEENPGLYLQSTAGGPLLSIQHKPGVQTRFDTLSPDGRSLYYTANDVQPNAYTVYRYDLATRTSSVAFDREQGLFHVSDCQNDGRLLLRKDTGELWSEYSEWDPRSQQLTPLFGQNEHEEYLARYGAREGELVVLTNKLSEYRRLYRFSQGSFTALGDEVATDVSQFDMDLARTRIVYTLNDRGYSRLRALDARSFAKVALPKLPVSDNEFYGTTTVDGRFSTLGIDDGRRPLAGYVLDWRSGKLTTWHKPSSPEIDTSSFVRAELGSYPARDGTAIPVFVRKPERCAGVLCPVIVIFHGGPEGQARPGFSVSFQSFLDAGFVLVEPNVRGSDGYGKSWIRADDGPKRLAVITDIEDAARWVRQHFAVDGKQPKVGVFGASYGGYSVLMAMAMFAGAYDAGVDVVGMSDLRTFLRNTAPYRRVLRIAEYGDPERDGEALAKLSPLTYLDRIKAPLLIEQGATDPRVPAGEAIQLHDALQKRGIPCELAIYPDEGHGMQRRENRVLMYSHTIEFFQRYLAPESQPDQR